MKKNWSIRAGREAVSPVIATILLVAITVVLASVLYILSLSFLPPGAGASIIGINQSQSNVNYTLTVTSVSGDLRFLGDCYVLIYNSDGELMINGPLSALNNTWTENVKFTDAMADGKLNAQDYFQMKKGSDFYTYGSKLSITDLGATTTLVTYVLQ